MRRQETDDLQAAEPAAAPAEKTEKPQKKPRGFLKKLKRTLILLLIFVAIVFGAFLYGRYAAGGTSGPEITSDLLEQRLQSVQDLVSVEYHYTNMGKFENHADFYGWRVPFTTKSFIISYDGTILAGVDLSQAQVSVSGDRVTVTLPDAAVISHEIPEDSIQVFDETRNIFNPITIEDYTGFTDEQKKEVQEKAIANGLLDRAEEEAAAAVDTLLRMLPGMDDYTLTVR